MLKRIFPLVFTTVMFLSFCGVASAEDFFSDNFNSGFDSSKWTSSYFNGGGYADFSGGNAKLVIPAVSSSSYPSAREFSSPFSIDATKQINASFQWGLGNNGYLDDFGMTFAVFDANKIDASGINFLLALVEWSAGHRGGLTIGGNGFYYPSNYNEIGNLYANPGSNWSIDLDNSATKFYKDNELIFESSSGLPQDTKNLYIEIGVRGYPGLAGLEGSTPYLVDSSAYFDNIRVTAVPEPVSTVLFSIGGVTLAVFKRLFTLHKKSGIIGFCLNHYNSLR